MSLLDLSRFTPVGSIDSFAGGNQSGADYNKNNGRVGLIRNGTAIIDEYDKDDLIANGSAATLIRTITLPNLDNGSDTEGFVYLPAGEIAVIAEHGGRNMFFILNFDENGTAPYTPPAPHTQITLKANNANNNSGPEGIEYFEDIDTFVIVIEGEESLTDRDVIFCKRPAVNGTYSYTDAQFAADHIYNNFNAETVFASYGATGAQFDLSDCTIHEPTGHLLISSHTGGKIIHIDPNTGTVLSELDHTFQQCELLCFVGDKLLGGGEPAQIQFFDPPVIVPPVMVQPPHAEIAKGGMFTYTPSLSVGSDVQWFKEFGPDDLTVNPETGEIAWDTSSIPRGQGVRVTIGCNNVDGEDLKTFVVHVDELGTSKLMLMNGAVDTAGGTPTTIATTIRAAAAEINSGDTLVIPSGHFWASTTATNSAENTWDEANLNELPTGLSNQHTTIISDGFTIIDSGPHDAIGRDDKGLEAGPTNTGIYYKFSGIEWTGCNRGPVLFRIDGALFEFCGGTDGSYAVTPTTQAQAGDPFANVAGVYIGGNSSAQNCFAFGDARYLFQSGNFVTASSFNRCIARPDEYNGTNPRGGIVHYSVDQSGTFSSYVIDGDQEDKSPFYNNYAGAFGLPATGNEAHAQSQLMKGCAVINVDINPILNDSNSGTNTLTIEDFLLLDTTNTVTPWEHNTSLMGIQSDSKITVSRLAMSETHRWNFEATTASVFIGAAPTSAINGAIFDRLGWDGVSATVNLADLASNVAIDNANIYDFKGAHIATNATTYDPKLNGWDYPVRAEAGSPIAALGQAPDLTLFAAPLLKLPTDTGWSDSTSQWAWPHPEEQQIAARMATYSKTNIAVRHPNAFTDPTDFTGAVNGARGFAAAGESFSEYIWGYFGRTVPPLRVSAQATGLDQITFRIGKYRSTRGDTITKFNVYEISDLVNPVLSFSGLKGVLKGLAYGTYNYVIRAVDTSKPGAYGANETGESGNSRTLAVTLDASAATEPAAILETGGGGTSSLLNLTYPALASTNGSDRAIVFAVIHESADLSIITGVQVGGVEATIVSNQASAAFDVIGAYILEADIPSMTSMGVTYTGGAVAGSNCVIVGALIENIDPADLFENLIDDGYDMTLAANTQNAIFDLIAKKDAIGIAFAACSKTNTTWTTGTYTQQGTQYTQSTNTAAIIATKSFTANSGSADTETFTTGLPTDKTAVFAMMVKAKVYVPAVRDGVINASLPDFTATFAATVANPITPIDGVISATLPDFTSAILASMVGAGQVINVISATLPDFSATMAATFAPPVAGSVDGVIAANLPDFTASFVAAFAPVAADITATISADLPTFTATLIAATFDSYEIAGVVSFGSDSDIAG